MESSRKTRNRDHRPVVEEEDVEEEEEEEDAMITRRGRNRMTSPLKGKSLRSSRYSNKETKKVQNERYFVQYYRSSLTLLLVSGGRVLYVFTREKFETTSLFSWINWLFRLHVNPEERQKDTGKENSAKSRLVHYG